MNNSRNRWLIGALSVVVIFYFGDMAFRSFYEEPLQVTTRLKGQLTKQIRDAKSKLARAEQITDQLAMLEQRSLPANSDLARSRYQAWLLQLAGDAKLTGTSVDAGDPVTVSYTARRLKRPLVLYRRITFSVHGRGDLNQITQFLYAFYDAGHLHKIKSLSLNPIGDGQIVDMNASIEALSLPTADRATELADVPVDQLAFDKVAPYRMISQRNLFGRGGAHWAWRQVQLSAITTNVAGVAEAWFAVGSSSRAEIVALGEGLVDGPVDLRVIELDTRRAIVEVDGQRFELRVGQSLADAQAVAQRS